MVWFTSAIVFRGPEAAPAGFDRLRSLREPFAGAAFDAAFDRRGLRRLRGCLPDSDAAFAGAAFESDAASLRAHLSAVPERWAHTFRPAEWTTFDGSAAQLFGPAWTGRALDRLSGEVEAAAACLRRESEADQMDAAQAPAAAPAPM